MQLKAKIALVTGASSGIGKATAIALAESGCTVIINYRSNDASATETLKACEVYGPGHTIIRADLTKEDEVRQMVQKIKDSYERIDALVSSAGIFDDDDGPFNVDSFRNIYENNFMSNVLVAKYVAEMLMKEGKMVFVSSVHGKQGYGRPTAIAYSAFKAALDSYVKNLAKALAPKILVNAVAPGRVATPMWDVSDPQKKERLGYVHLIKRMIEPEEVADSILFLIKNDAMCGEVLTIDGGMSLVTLG